MKRAFNLMFAAWFLAMAAWSIKGAEGWPEWPSVALVFAAVPFMLYGLAEYYAAKKRGER